QLVDLAELDRVRRARLRAGRLVAALQAVVAERALPHAPVLLLPEQRQRERRVSGAAWKIALVDHAERTRGNAVAAAVADVFLHDDGAELGAEERARRARVEAAGVRAVLADVGLHQPAQGGRGGGRVDRGRLAVELQRLALLDERDVARLAADAHRRIGEEAHARLRLVAVRDALVRVRLERGAHVVSVTSSG